MAVCHGQMALHTKKRVKKKVNCFLKTEILFIWNHSFEAQIGLRMYLRGSTSSGLIILAAPTSLAEMAVCATGGRPQCTNGIQTWTPYVPEIYNIQFYTPPPPSPPPPPPPLALKNIWIYVLSLNGYSASPGLSTSNTIKIDHSHKYLGGLSCIHPKITFQHNNHTCTCRCTIAIYIYMYIDIWQHCCDKICQTCHSVSKNKTLPILK